MIPYLRRFKPSLCGVLTSIALVAVASPRAFGDTLELIAGSSYSNPANPYQAGEGGEFTALQTNADGSVATSWVPTGYSSLATYTFPAGSAGGLAGLTGFETFCVEYAQEFYPGPNQPYNYTITPYLQGNNPNPLDGTPLAVGVSWLYSLFATGSSQLGYDFTNASSMRQTDAGLLQNTIWWLLNEGPSGAGSFSYDSTNPYMSLVVNHFGSISNAMALANPEAYGVEVLNLTSNNLGGYNQNQLIYVGTPVPDEGATLSLLAIALVGFVAIRRRSFGAK